VASTPARPTRRTRAERRSAERARPATPPPRAAAAAAITPARLLFVLWVAATSALFVFTALGVERKITWYLAVDQYGYLAFAHDLAHGRVFHHWPPLDALAAKLPERVDVLSQTYVFDKARGLLYCRYAPGFAIVLAGWLRLFGDDGAHYLNPTVFIVLLAVLLVFQARVFRSRWRATAGVALVVLFPTMLHLWSLTLVRDLPTHLAAFVGLLLLLPVKGRPLGWRRTAAAGVALGFAGSCRPDTLVYLGSAVLIAVARWRHERARLGFVLRGLAAGLLGVVVGLAPFLAYNWAATGSPFRPTQGMEVQLFPSNAPPPPLPPPPLPRIGYPSGAWHGGTVTSVQGGGLRLVNIPRVLPGIIGLLRAPYGDVILGLAVWGAIVALVRRRLLFLAAVPYIVLAVLFYSCWSKPDARYLVGVYFFISMLIVEGVLGTMDVARRLARSGTPGTARWFAAGFAILVLIAALIVREPQAVGALPMLLVLVPGFAVVSALAQTAWPARRVSGIASAAFALAMVTLACWRGAQGLNARATFQRPQMLRARATFAQSVPPGGVVITTEDVGRPGENIDYYSGVAHAFYLTDLMRWRLTIADAASLLANAGFTPYLLIPTTQPHRGEMLASLGDRFTVELAADIPKAKAIDYFTAAAFYPGGIHMELYRLTAAPRLDAPGAGH